MAASSPKDLRGRCSACEQTLPVARLNLVIVNHGDAPTALLCGPCLVDGFTSQAVA